MMLESKNVIVGLSKDDLHQNHAVKIYVATVPAISIKTASLRENLVN